MEGCGCFSSIARAICGKESAPRAKYSEHEYTIEFENLIEEEDFYAPAQNVVSDVEKKLLKKGRFGELLQHQQQLGERQEEILRQQEEDARLEDEAYVQAKKEAAKARKLKQTFDKNTLAKLRMNNTVEFSKWLAEEEIDVTSPNLDIEDFDSFLEKMRAKNKALSLDDEDDSAHFEQTLKQGVKATKIAGDAMNALQPVELHAVSNITSTSTTATHHSSAINNHDQSYGRPFTPDFSSITSNASDLSISTNNTPSKDLPRDHDGFDTSRTENSSSIVSASSDIEATPTNDSTFVVSSRDESSRMNGDDSYSKTHTPTTITTKALITTPRSANKANTSSISNGDAKTYHTPSSSFKLMNNLNLSDSKRSLDSSSASSARGFDNSAFLGDSSGITNGGDSDGSGGFGDFGDDDDFVSADGDFEEMLV